MIEAAWLLFSISVGLVYLVCSKRVVKVVWYLFWISVLLSHFSPFTLIYTLFESGNGLILTTDHLGLINWKKILCTRSLISIYIFVKDTSFSVSRFFLGMVYYIEQGEHENLSHPGDSCRHGWSWDFDDELTKMLWVNSLLVGMKWIEWWLCCLCTCVTDGGAVFVYIEIIEVLLLFICLIFRSLLGGWREWRWRQWRGHYHRLRPPLEDIGNLCICGNLPWCLLLGIQFNRLSSSLQFAWRYQQFFHLSNVCWISTDLHYSIDSLVLTIPYADEKVFFSYQL